MMMLGPSCGRTRSSHSAGFTLIEILVVIVIVLILVGMLVAGLMSSTESARKSQTRLTLKNASGIADEFTRINNGYVLQIKGTPYEDTGNPPAALKGMIMTSATACTDPQSNSIAFVAATNVGTLTSQYNSFPKGTLQSASGLPTPNTYIVDAWGFPIIYLAYGSGFLPTSASSTTYDRPFLVSGGVPKVKGRPNPLGSSSSTDQRPYLYSFGEVTP